jgi:hypothetical protein
MSHWLFKRTANAERSSVVGDASGNTFTASAISGTAVEITCVSSSGTVTWKNTLTGAFTNVCLATDGTYLYLATEDYNAQEFLRVLQLSPSTGAIYWQKDYTPNGGEEIYLGGICIDGDSHLLLGGSMFAASNYVYALRISYSNGSIIADGMYDTGASSLPYVGGVACDPTYMIIGGGYDASTAYWLQLNRTTLATVSSQKVTWTGISGLSATDTMSAYRDSGGVGWIGGRGGVVNVNTNARYKYTSGSPLKIAPYGGQMLIAETISNTETRLRRVTTAGFTPQIEFSFAGGSGQLAVGPQSVQTVGTDFGIALHDTANGTARTFRVSYTDSPSEYGTYDGYVFSAPTGTNATTDTATLTSYSTSRAATTYAATTPSSTYGASAATQTVTALIPPTTGTIAKPFQHTISSAIVGTGPVSGTVAAPFGHTLTGALTLVHGDGVDTSLPHLTGSFSGQYTLGVPLPKVTGVIDASNPTVLATMNPSIPSVEGALVCEAIPYGQTNRALPKVTGAIVAWRTSTITTDVNLPRVTASAEAMLGNTGDIAGVMPLVQVAAAGGGQSSNASLPRMNAAIEAVSGIVSGIDLRLPAVTASAEGVNTVVGVIDGTLKKAAAVVEAIQGNVAAIDGALRGITGSSEAVLGSAGSVAVVLPEPTAQLGGSAAIYAVLSARLPTLGTTAFTSLRIYEHVLTHVMNTISTAVTTFENYEYNSFTKFNGRYLAAGPGGIVIVDQGDKDDTTNIDAAMLSGELDFNSPQLKRMSDFYLAMRAAGNIALTVSTDEMGAYDYTIKPYDIETLKQRRDLIGKGMRGRYWQFGLSNTDGCDFDFDAYSMLVVDTSRRV